MRTQVCYAATGFGLAVVAAALTDRVLPEADRRVLVVANNAVIPATAYGAADLTGAAALLEMFDDVYSYNDAIAPQHPSMWQPRDIDLPMSGNAACARCGPCESALVLPAWCWLASTSSEPSPSVRPSPTRRSTCTPTG